MLFGEQYNTASDERMRKQMSATASAATGFHPTTSMVTSNKSNGRGNENVHFMQQASNGMKGGSTSLTQSATSRKNGKRHSSQRRNSKTSLVWSPPMSHHEMGPAVHHSNRNVLSKHQLSEQFNNQDLPSGLSHLPARAEEGFARSPSPAKVKAMAKANNRTMYESVWTMLGFRKKVHRLSAISTAGKSICVTGVDGFVASWIVADLLAKGYRVRGTVQSRSDDITGILNLPNAQTHLRIVEASLLTPESCDLAVEGCEYIIHTGTPTSCSVRDPLSESQEPGVHSIGSRMHCIIPMMTNFIQACSRVKAKKVVFTSSVAAIADDIVPPNTVNETFWNFDSTLEKNPHYLSLKLAEEAAWQLVDQMPRGSKFDFISINCGTLFGPVLCSRKKIPPGNQVVYDLVSGHYSALVDLNWAFVDVRDCARAHVAVLESFESVGRYICVNRTVWMREIVETLASNGFSGRDLPWQVGLPNWVARLPSYSMQLGQVGASLYAEHPYGYKGSPFLNDKLIETMDFQFTDAKTTIVDTARGLLKCGLIKPWAEDHESMECNCCKTAFTFYRRKHHCRECGVIVCALCSQSRAVVEGIEEKARLCDDCVQSSIPALLDLLLEKDVDNQRKGIQALESLLENVNNHVYLTRRGGIPSILALLHASDLDVVNHAAGALLTLSTNISSSLQLVLEGAVLQMLEVDDASSTWRVVLQALRNIWKQVNKQDFRQLLFAVARVSTDAAIGALKGNILLTFVHMMETAEIPTLLPEGLASVIYTMLTSENVYPRCAAAHAIKRLLPSSYSPDVAIEIPPYVVDDHEELLANAALSDLQFFIAGHTTPIYAHKVVLFFRSSYFKNMFGATTGQKSTLVIDDCSYEIFSMLLRFLYTGKVLLELASAPALLQAASTYQVMQLQKRIEKFLSSEVTVEKVVEFFYLADSCNAEDLKRVCVVFMMKHIHAVVALDSFENHRIWASQEVLKALSTILEGEWEIYCQNVVRTARSEVPELMPLFSPINPVIKEHCLPRDETFEERRENTDILRKNGIRRESIRNSSPKRIHRSSDELLEGVC